MSGIQQLLMGGGAAAGAVNIDDYGAIANSNSPVNGVAQYKLVSDGTISATTGTNSLNTVGEWAAGDSDPSLYEARATAIGDAPDSGTMDTWLALTSTRTWAETDGPAAGETIKSFLLEIRRASSGVVVTSATITLTAETIV